MNGIKQQRSLSGIFTFLFIMLFLAASAQNTAGNPDTNLPANFPRITVKTIANPSSANFFIAPFSSWGMFTDIDNYIAIIDNFGHPIYFKKIKHNSINDFKLQPNGQLSFGGGSGIKHYIMNEKMELIDSLRPIGYWIDYHDFIITPDNQKWLIGIDTRLIDMSTIVPGGQPDATIMGHVIQALDSLNNVFFEWNTWDHFSLTDCEPYVDLTASLIDFAHVNTLELDSDTSFIILARNMNEITKVDRRTGEIIWRMGGIHNEFTFINDTIQWAWPHDIRKIGEGIFTLFDNGRFNTPEPHYSSGVIYNIDETARTITQVKRYRNDPDIYGGIMGNFQMLENGNFISGWGSGSYPDSMAITEFNADGAIEHIINFNAINYRAYKYNWQPKLFYPKSDTLDFGKSLLSHGENLAELKIFNNSDSIILLSGYHFRFDQFSLDTSFPIEIQPKDSILLKVRFQPTEAGYFENALTLHADNADTTQRIGRQIYLKAEAVDDTGIDEPSAETLSVSPNPAHSFATVTLPQTISGRARIFDFSGNSIMDFEFGNKKSLTIDLENFTKGIYFLEITSRTNKLYSTKIIRY
ncbi:MAG: aryl-sulfate sulfotransferase [Bacteroidales bacterium]|nr:aryl-sulfate sulfotransferase [Bacteroidales bacterium]